MPREPEYNRANILAAAMQVFWQNGYEASSIQKLLDAMGINRGSLYAGFGGKEDLFRDVLLSYGEAVEQLIAELRDFDKANNPVATLRRFFDCIFLQKGPEGLQHGCLLCNTITELATVEPQLAMFARERIKPVRDMFSYYLAKAQQAGGIAASQDIEVLSDSLLSMMAGLAVLNKMDVDVAQQKKIIDTFFDSLLPEASAA